MNKLYTNLNELKEENPNAILKSDVNVDCEDGWAEIGTVDNKRILAISIRYYDTFSCTPCSDVMLRYIIV